MELNINITIKKSYRYEIYDCVQGIEQNKKKTTTTTQNSIKK